LPDRPKDKRKLNHRRFWGLVSFDLSIRLEPCATGTLLTWEAVFEDHAFAEGLREFLTNANEKNLDRLALEVESASQ